MNYLATWDGCTIPPLARGEVFSHLGGVYSPSVSYLATWDGCTSPLGGVYSTSVNYLATWEGCTIPP